MQKITQSDFEILREKFCHNLEFKLFIEAVEDKLGVEYRKRAQQIIHDYTMGENRNYYDDESSLKSINKRSFHKL